MRNVYLHGHLAEQFGSVFAFEVMTAGEAMRALNCAFPGKFIAALREGSYRVVRGAKDDGMELDIELVTKLRLGQADLHVIPVAEGAAKSRGTMGGIKAIAGVALIGTAIFMSGGTLAAPLAGMAGIIPGTAVLGASGMSWGTLATIGVGLTLAGVATILARPDKPKEKDDSFTMSGPTNTYEQGNPVPLIYGEVICGGQPISVGLDIENLATYPADWAGRRVV